MPGIEIEHLDELRRRRLGHLSELVDHTRLGERVRHVEQALLEQADLARPETAEAAHPIGARVHGIHPVTCHRQVN